MATPDSTRSHGEIQIYSVRTFLLCTLLFPLALCGALIAFEHTDWVSLIAAIVLAVSALCAIGFMAHDALKGAKAQQTVVTTGLPLLDPHPSSLVKFPIPGQYIYIIQDEDVTGLCKIGKTSDPARRLYDHGVLLPFSTRTICILPVRKMAKTEAALHRVFASKRVRGEWFALDASDISKIIEVLA
jgi:hypothetical protein